MNRIIREIRDELYVLKEALLLWFDEDIKILQYQPIDGGWNSLKVLEHITLTSHYLLKIIDKGARKAKQRAVTNSIDVDWSIYKLIPKELADIGIHKSFEWIRPEHMEPTGEVSLEAIKSRMSEQLDKCDNYLDDLKGGEGVLCMTTMSVNNIGKMDVYQYIFFLLLHARRHIMQLEENKMEYEIQKNEIEK